MQAAIETSRGELEARLQALRPGMTVADVRAILAGDEFQTEVEGGRVLRFWRFHLEDAPGPSQAFAIYQGQFQGDGFIEGWILPNG